MVFVLQRTAQSPPVLMAGNAVHRVFLSIQIESFAGNDLVFAQAQRLHHFVDHFPVPDQAAHDLIQIRVLPALPQGGILDLEIGFERLYALRCQVERAALGCYLLPFPVVNRVLQSERSRLQRPVVQLHFHFYIRLLFGDILLGDIDTGRSTIGHTYIIRICHDQPNRAIHPAVNAEKHMVDGNHVRT